MIGKRIVADVPTGDFCIFGSSLDEVPSWAIDEGRALAGPPSMYPIESTSGVKPNGWTVGRWHDELHLLVYGEAWGEVGRGVVVQSHVLMVTDELSKQMGHNCWPLAWWLNTRKESPWFRFPSFESASAPPAEIDPIPIDPATVLKSWWKDSVAIDRIRNLGSVFAPAAEDILRSQSAVIKGFSGSDADRLLVLLMAGLMVKAGNESKKGRPDLVRRIAATTHPRARLGELVDVGFEDPLMDPGGTD